MSSPPCRPNSTTVHLPRPSPLAPSHVTGLCGGCTLSRRVTCHKSRLADCRLLGLQIWIAVYAWFTEPSPLSPALANARASDGSHVRLPLSCLQVRGVTLGGAACSDCYRCRVPFVATACTRDRPLPLPLAWTHCCSDDELGGGRPAGPGAPARPHHRQSQGTRVGAQEPASVTPMPL